MKGYSMPSATKAKSVPVIPILLTIGAVCGLAVLAERIYHRPRETMIDLVRAGMLLAGMREETCNLAGVTMHYYCAGRRGTPVVLIHGLGSSAETWAALMPLLSKEFLVYAPDLPGFGKTPLAPEGTNISIHVLYLERFLDVLGYPRVTMVGNSLGGWIATRFAVEHPERVNRLYLLNGAGLIPTCVLRATSKMREVGHRTETLRIGFQLIESVTDLVNDLIERGQSQIRACAFRALLPRHVRRDSA